MSVRLDLSLLAQYNWNSIQCLYDGFFLLTNNEIMKKGWLHHLYIEVSRNIICILTRQYHQPLFDLLDLRHTVPLWVDHWSVISQLLYSVVFLSLLLLSSPGVRYQDSGCNCWQWQWRNAEKYWLHNIISEIQKRKVCPLPNRAHHYVM